MGFRILIALLVVACAYFVFESVRMVLLKNAMIKAEPEHVLGNPEGDLSIAVFFDYNCRDCRDKLDAIQEASKADGNIKLILRPVTVLNHAEDVPGGHIHSDTVIYAAAKQDSFADMHDVLLDNYRVINEQSLQDLALLAGIDATQLKEDVADQDVLQYVDENHRLFARSRLAGIPAIMIGDKFWFVQKDDTRANELIDLFRQARGN